MIYLLQWEGRSLYTIFSRRIYPTMFLFYLSIARLFLNCKVHKINSNIKYILKNKKNTFKQLHSSYMHISSFASSSQENPMWIISTRALFPKFKITIFNYISVHRAPTLPCLKGKTNDKLKYRAGSQQNQVFTYHT